MAEGQVRQQPILQLEQATALFRGEFLAGFTLRDSAPFEEWALLQREYLGRLRLRALHRLTAYHADHGAHETALRYAWEQVRIEPWEEEAHQQLMALLAITGQRTVALAHYDSLRETLDLELGVEPSPETQELVQRIESGEIAPVEGARRDQIVRGYDLIERIGQGNAGAVYRAYQPILGRQVAVKVILPHHANHPEFIRRFEVEAQLVARLEHLHIVPLYDYWREPDGAYLVMRLFQAGSLRDSLARGPWSPAAVARALDQLASALAAAHGQGVVHQDIKPANILLDKDGNAYLSDFGIARDLAVAPDPAAPEPLTGSPEYASPEQWLGEPSTPLADIYSLGVVLYELLAGAHPYPEATPKQMRQKHLKESVPPVRVLRPELPPGVDAVIQKATAKEPGHRYPDAVSLAEAFHQCLQLPAADSPQIEPRNPYKGLRPFQEADAVDFFGREALSRQLTARMAGGGRFLAVVGPSGSGKSSVVHAGLIPRLRQGGLPGSEGWYIVAMQPGHAPFERLEEALLRIASEPPKDLHGHLHGDSQGLARAVSQILPPGGGELLLVVDQFEELFTLVRDEAERARFLSNLLAAVSEPGSRLRLVVTLRADHYDRPLQYAGFGELVRQQTEVVLPLSAEELEQAIAGPARRTGVSLETGLVATIVADVIEEPGALPLLQHTLTELFEVREGRELGLQAYQELGGVLGSLGRRAEALYGSLDAAGQGATRQLFLRLVSLREGQEPGRRRALRPELSAMMEDGQAVETAIDAYGRHRLLSFDRDPVTRIPTVEVAHEALFRAWDRLRDWLDESRDDLRAHQQLSRAVAEWLNSGRDAGYLLQGTRLDQFEAWSWASALALSPDEQDYLQASLAGRQARKTEEADRQAREAALEQRSRRRLQALVAILAIATLMALALTVYAFSQRRDALEAYSLSLAANARNALDSGDSAKALALSLAANRIDRPPRESQRVLMEAAYAPGPRRQLSFDRDLFGGAGTSATAVAISPNGRTALASYCTQAGTEYGQRCAAGTPSRFVLWDVESGEAIRMFEGHTAGVNELAYSPDGETALSGSEDATLIEWNPTTGRERRRFEGHSGAVHTVAVSPDGRTAASGGRAGDAPTNPGELILWDLDSGWEIRRLEGATAEVMDVAFTPDGSMILASMGDSEQFVNRGEPVELGMRLWDVETGQLVRSFDLAGDDATSLAISPDGATALSGGWDRTVYLWDLSTGERVTALEGHTDPIMALAFDPAPGSRRAVSGSDDNSLILWDLESAEPVARLMARDSDVLDVALSSDGQMALSASRDGTLVQWDLYDGGELGRFEGHPPAVFDTAFSPDGTRFLSSGGNPDPASPLAGDTNIRLWDLETGQELRRLEGHTGTVLQVAFAPDGRTALSSSNDQSVRLWDLETGEEIGRFVGHETLVTSIAFGPDGEQVLSGSVDGTLILWDLENGEVLHRLAGHTLGVWSVAVSPDGTTALSGADDSILILWDLETGKELRRFLGHSQAEDASVSGVAYLPDGKTALSGGTDGFIIHWDLETGQEIGRFGGHSGIRTRVSVSPDGRTAFTSSWDGTLMVWDLETGEMLRRFRDPQTGPVFDSAMSPDGKTGLVGSFAGSIVHWQLAAPDLDELRAWIEANRYVRELSCEERDLYQIEPLCKE